MFWNSTRHIFAVVSLLLGGSLSLSHAAPPGNSAELFDSSRIWSVHLSLDPEQWAAMEPPARDQEPGHGHGPGPAPLLAPAFLAHGDQNQDGQLSAAEFQALAVRWFTLWDNEKAGSLKLEQLRAAMGLVFAPPRNDKGQSPGGKPPGMVATNGKRNGLAGASGVDFPYVEGALDFDGAKLSEVAIRYKGNNTYMMSRHDLKRPLKLDLNKYVKGQKLASVSTINLHNNVNDPGAMNEALSYRLFRDAGVPASRTSYARVFLTVSGTYADKYVGLYSIVENIDKNFLAERFGTRKGALFKPTPRDLFADLGDDWEKYTQIYDPKDEISEEDAKRVIAFARLVSKADDKEFASQLANYLDLDEFARYMAVLVWLPSMDSILEMGQNFYIYLNPATGKFVFLPWDFDHSFGQWPMGGNTETLSIQKPWRGQNRFLERVFAVEAFKKLYLGYLAEFSKTIFQPQRILAQVDELAPVLRPAIAEEDVGKATRFDKVVAGESLPAPTPPKVEGGGPGAFPPPPQFGNLAPIKTFVPRRAQNVLDQLSGNVAASPTVEPPHGPEMFLAATFLEKLDTNKDGKLTAEEFGEGFSRWFGAWDTNKNGLLTEEELTAGIAKEFPRPGGPPPGQPPQGH